MGAKMAELLGGPCDGTQIYVPFAPTVIHRQGERYYYQRLRESDGYFILVHESLIENPEQGTTAP